VARVGVRARRRLGRPHCSGMVGVALELSVIIGWPITGGGRGQGPPVDQSGAGGRKATSVTYPQTPVGYAHGRNDK